MIDLDEKLGFMRWRIAALALNLAANAVALYAAIRYIRNGTHGGTLVVGLAVTVACIALLARPDTRPAGPGGGAEEEEGSGVGGTPADAGG